MFMNLILINFTGNWVSIGYSTIIFFSKLPKIYIKKDLSANN